ncbi:MarR family winged helix-turn-helix transcriptional regulator [Demequina capsici]|uniref:MarR family transcriptional regulator n=1 Tax=Demequina capsici TaxID=3075620 RepID=A0AA96JBK4_9MICO|nr:MarR family transcriptional regulator [Demequina sp. OYTSA14]WNM25816.1 MarR family transcriptional regulator [Demequina sp. OYTSA14]
MDAVEHFLTQWRTEAPSIDVTPMATIGRLNRLSGLVQTRIDAVFDELGLQSWEFDVLATLTRQGAPYAMTAGDLERQMMITSGTTTHRIGRLEQRGFVERRKDDDDRRVVWVTLTDAGRQACLEAYPVHLENERRILASMDAEDVAALTRGLVALAAALRDAPALPRTPALRR